MPLQALRNKVTGLYFNGVSFAEKLLDDASVQKDFNPMVVRTVWGENAEIVDLCVKPTHALVDAYGSSNVETFSTEQDARARRDELLATKKWETGELQIWDIDEITP